MLSSYFLIFCWCGQFNFRQSFSENTNRKKTQSSNSSNILLSLYRSFINSEYTVTYNYVQRNSLLLFISSLTTSFSTHYFYPHFSLQTLHTQLCTPQLFTSNFAHPTLHTPTFHTQLTKCSPFYTFCVWGTQHTPEPDLLHIGILDQPREPERDPPLGNRRCPHREPEGAR